MHTSARSQTRWGAQRARSALPCDSQQWQVVRGQNPSGATRRPHRVSGLQVRSRSERFRLLEVACERHRAGGADKHAGWPPRRPPFDFQVALAEESRHPILGWGGVPTDVGAAWVPSAVSGAAICRSLERNALCHVSCSALSDGTPSDGLSEDYEARRENQNKLDERQHRLSAFVCGAETNDR